MNLFVQKPMRHPKKDWLPEGAGRRHCDKRILRAYDIGSLAWHRTRYAGVALCDRIGSGWRCPARPLARFTPAVEGPYQKADCSTASAPHKIKPMTRPTLRQLTPRDVPIVLTTDSLGEIPPGVDGLEPPPHDRLHSGDDLVHLRDRCMIMLGNADGAAAKRDGVVST